MAHPLDAFTDRTTFPFTIGVYLAVNAIRDAYLVIDGPSCSFLKAETVFGTHDVASNLLDVGGRHRVIHTKLDPDMLIGGRASAFVETLRVVHASGAPGVVLVGALPMAAITGVVYDDLAREASAAGSPQVIVLPTGSLDRDWLDGYAAVLERLAEDLDLGGPPARDPSKVAVVGYMMDRNEGDHRGNLAEIRRLVRALGLDLAGVWPGGGPVSDLAATRDAGTVVALPHGRRAGELLARRLGAALVEAEVPFGLEATGAFVRKLAAATGREAEAASLIDRELALVARAVEWLIPKRLASLRAGFIGDPHMIPGFCSIAEMVGLEVRFVVATASPRPGFEPDSDRLRGVPVAIGWQPRRIELSDLLEREAPELDVLVSCQDKGMGRVGDVPLVRFGYPSYDWHTSGLAPFLGYEGFLTFVDRISNEVGDRTMARL